MTAVSIAQAREHLAEILNKAIFGKERILLTRHSKPVGAFVPLEDYELLEALEDRLDLEDALAVLKDPNAEFIDWNTAKP
ncbi:MAG: type II toxin-antitoxin system Phd/YefM family antitoxin [Candidatus Neomarinimicrobiota bacterium]